MIGESDLTELRALLPRMTIEQKLTLLAAVKREVRSQSPRAPSQETGGDLLTPSYQ